MIGQSLQHYLYRHIRLDKNEPFYVGIGTTQNKYLKSSEKYRYQRAYNKQRSNWWSKITNKTDYEFIKQKEIEFIALYGRRDLGKGTLVNLTDGGDGGLGRVVTQETKNNQSVLMKGRKHTEEALENIKNAHSIKNEKYIKEREGKEYKTKLSI